MLTRRASMLVVATFTVSLAVGPAAGQRQVTISTSKDKPAHPANSSYALPNNFYGAHLLVDDGLPGTKGYNHLRWARHLVGRWGYAKTLVMGIDKNTRGPAQG